MNKEFLLAAISGLGLLCGCSGASQHNPGNTDPAQPTPTDTVSGTVLFKGAGLAGATVVAIMTNTSSIYQTTTTDANGNYSFTGISATGDVPGNYDFFAVKSGYGFYPSVGSGAKVIRTDQTTMFQGGNNVNAIELALQVINYTAVPNASLTGADFMAYNATNAPVTLSATGQTTSYAAGDDGALQKGAALSPVRFTDNRDGTITDTLTGLVWLKNAGCFTAAVWATALVDVNHLADRVLRTWGRFKSRRLALAEPGRTGKPVGSFGAKPSPDPGKPLHQCSHNHLLVLDELLRRRGRVPASLVHPHERRALHQRRRE